MAKRQRPVKKQNPTKEKLRADFKNGTLSIKDLGTFFEMMIEYRGYYIRNRRAHWAGPWRIDQFAAAADVFPYVQQGYPTGIEMKQS